MKGNIRLAIFAAAGAAGLATLAASRPSSSLDIAAARVVDLTHAFDEKTIYWPNSPSTFKLTKLADGATEGGYYYRMNSFCAPEHG